MSIDSQVKSAQTLNGTGHFVNGAISSFAMMPIMNPVSVIANSLMGGHGWPPLKALYKGFWANTIAIVPSQAVSFAAYGFAIKKLAKKEKPSEQEKCLASCFSAFAQTPGTTLSERIAVVQQQARIVYGENWSIGKAYSTIVEKEGLAGLQKGAFPVFLRDCVFLLFLFSVSDQVENGLKKSISDKTTREITASSLTGAACGTVTAPIAVVKTRMQNLGTSCSMTEMVRKIIQEEGIKALTNGFVARAFFVSGATMLIFQGKMRFPAYFPNALHTQKSTP